MSGLGMKADGDSKAILACELSDFQNWQVEHTSGSLLIRDKDKKIMFSRRVLILVLECFITQAGFSYSQIQSPPTISPLRSALGLNQPPTPLDALRNGNATMLELPNPVAPLCQGSRLLASVLPR
jgi:hypothetical protein